ncbi:ATP-binding protein [Pseudalkalibacillus caeni]|uniref:histidine kinase n=1 Tax=Exobacillus caeni TaxID=2574798 RepID=A0A5R9F0J4_9BACL|nr:ATP-binding protein [Pseudalkalibacillus caeni]TLS34938.1 PAS domain S-box protein [Pseudalkalibacillus caeni]
MEQNQPNVKMDFPSYKNYKESSKQPFHTAFFENHPDVVCLLSKQKKVQLFNQVAERVTGYIAREITHQSFNEMVDKETRFLFSRGFEKALNGETTEQQMKIKTKSGDMVHLHAKLFPAKGETGVEGVFLVARDNKAEQEKNETALIAAGAAHEIKNQLTTLKGFTKLIQNGSENKDEHCNIIMSELERMEYILEVIGSSARPLTFEFKEEQIEDVIEGVLDLLRKECETYQVQVTTEIESNLPYVEIDEKRLKQVFINILKNAMEAMVMGGHVHINVTKNDSEILIAFKDNGCGIPDSHLHQIGKPFYTTKEKGTGLGLLISKMIIEAHKGKMAITSKEGEGTTITISLPVSR